LIPQFTSVIEARVGKTRHWEDLKNRLATWAKVFGERIPATITRDEVMTYLGSSQNLVATEYRKQIRFASGKEMARSVSNKGAEALR
jgi:hypothetical protein